MTGSVAVMQKSVETREGALSAVECLTYKLGRYSFAARSLQSTLLVTIHGVLAQRHVHQATDKELRC